MREEITIQVTFHSCFLIFTGEKERVVMTVESAAKLKYERLRQSRQVQLCKSRSLERDYGISHQQAKASSSKEEEEEKKETYHHRDESVEAILDGFDVSVTWITEKNKVRCVPSPTIETDFRRKVMHGVLENQYKNSSKE